MIHHCLSIYSRTNDELIVTIHLTPLQFLALQPHILANPNDPDRLLCYSLAETCEAFVEAHSKD